MILYYTVNMESWPIGELVQYGKFGQYFINMLN